MSRRLTTRLFPQPDSIRTVQDALMRLSQPQVSASGFGNASQQVLIESLPQVLVLHLNRVRYDASAGGIMKIQKAVEFSPELEIPLGTIFTLSRQSRLRILYNFVISDIMVPNAQRPLVPPHYKLYGVLYHHGESAGGGHYTVDVLHQNVDSGSEVWLHIDDEEVSPMRHEDVFGEHGAERAADRALCLSSLLLSDFPDRYIMTFLYSPSRELFVIVVSCAFVSLRLFLSQSYSFPFLYDAPILAAPYHSSVYIVQ